MSNHQRSYALGALCFLAALLMWMTWIIDTMDRQDNEQASREFNGRVQELNAENSWTLFYAACGLRQAPITACVPIQVASDTDINGKVMVETVCVETRQGRVWNSQVFYSINR